MAPSFAVAAVVAASVVVVAREAEEEAPSPTFAAPFAGECVEASPDHSTVSPTFAN